MGKLSEKSTTWKNIHFCMQRYHWTAWTVDTRQTVLTCLLSTGKSVWRAKHSSAKCAVKVSHITCRCTDTQKSFIKFCILQQQSWKLMDTFIFVQGRSYLEKRFQKVSLHFLYSATATTKIVWLWLSLKGLCMLRASSSVFLNIANIVMFFYCSWLKALSDKGTKYFATTL